MNNVPKLRFPDFSGEWKEIKLGDIGENIIGLTYSPKDVVYNNKFPIVLRSSNIKEGKLILNDIVRVKSKIQEKLLTRHDDILICTRNGSQNLIGKNTIIGERDELTTFGAFMSVYRSDQNYFIAHLFKTNNYSKQIQKNLGARINQITTGYLNKFRFYIPVNKDEKIKIAIFFKSIDNWINNLKEQKESLDKYKKGMMQKIFAQEIKFKDENGNDFPECEEKKMGQMGIFVSDGNYGEMYPKANEMISVGIPFIRANNIKERKIIWDDMKFIDNNLHKILTSGHLQTGDILVTTRGDIGMLAYVDKEFNDANINAQICLLRVNKDTSSMFLLYFLDSKIGQKQFKELQTGSALKQLPKGNLAKIKINLPSFKEQQKIADFLTSIDKLLDSKQQQIAKAEEWKKGLMQGLFV